MYAHTPNAPFLTSTSKSNLELGNTKSMLSKYCQCCLSLLIQTNTLQDSNSTCDHLFPLYEPHVN